MTTTQKAIRAARRWYSMVGRNGQNRKFTPLVCVGAHLDEARKPTWKELVEKARWHREAAKLYRSVVREQAKR